MRHYQSQGVLGVDLELAALFAVGEYRQVAVAGLLVVSDELADLTWQPGFRSPAFRQGRRDAARVALGAPARRRQIMFEGSLLALDVGGGTQDLFLWDAGQTVENAVKMVLPAPTQVLARRLQRLTAQGRPVFLGGRLMGGGALTQAVRRHLAQGLPVYASPRPP